MKLTSLKYEDQLIEDLESLIKTHAKKQNEDERYIRSMIVFLCGYRQEVLDDLHEKSMRVVHDAIWGEGR